MKNLLSTEAIPPQEIYIDMLDNKKALLVMLENQTRAFSAVKEALVEIENAADIIYKNLINIKK